MTQALEKIPLSGLPQEIVSLGIQRNELSTDVVAELNEIRLAAEANLANQVNAHSLKLKQKLVKKRMQNIGAQLVDTVEKHHDHIRLRLTCNLGHTHSIDVIEKGEDVEKYPSLIPMGAIENVIDIQKKGIFDDIKIHQVWEDPDPIVIGRIGNALFVLGQWE